MLVTLGNYSQNAFGKSLKPIKPIGKNSGHLLGKRLLKRFLLVVLVLALVLVLVLVSMGSIGIGMSIGISIKT